MADLGLGGPGQKGPEDKRAQKYLFKPGPLRTFGPARLVKVFN